MKVEFLNLKRQYLSLQEDVEKAVIDCMRSTAYIEGPLVKELEKELTEYIGCKYVISCASGTDALKLALKACGVGYGDEVITTPFTFFATSEAIASVGAIPVYADVCKDSYNIDPDKIENKITDKTKAILPVHIFGSPADMDRINKIAEKYQLKVIEDAAQAMGSVYKGKKAGNLGTAGCFSFYPTKNLGAFGDAGLVTTNDENIANAVRALKSHGAGKIGAKAYEMLHGEPAEGADNINERSKSDLYDPYKYYNYLIADNSRLDSIQAAVLLVKLKKLDEYNQLREKVAQYYCENLENLPIQLPVFPETGKSCWHQFAIMVPDRESFVDYLTSKEIGTGAFYPVPMHLQKALKYLGYKKGACPVAEYLCDHSVCLPIFPELAADEISHVVDTIREFFEK